VIGQGETKINMQPLGQAQTWTGTRFGVLWEAYIHTAGRREGWEETLAQVWRVVEKDMEVEKIFTTSHDPEFEETFYHAFLTRLGCAAELGASQWWSKTVT
jgi:hypothetical protein